MANDILYDLTPWEDTPSTLTPINAENLNARDRLLKKVVDKTNELSGQNGFSTEAIDKLEEVGNYLAFTTSTGGTKWRELIAILRGGTVNPDVPDTPDNPEVTLTSISATCTGGNVLVGTSLTDLTGITVTAHYSDGSTANVTGYTLSGTIEEGSNTITVSYGGKTTTFTVTGISESGGEEPDNSEPILQLSNIELDGTEDAYTDTGVSVWENKADSSWTIAVDFTTDIKQGCVVWAIKNGSGIIALCSASDYAYGLRYGKGSGNSVNLTNLDISNGVKVVVTHEVGQGGATVYYLKDGVITSGTATGTVNNAYDNNLVYGSKASASTNFTGTINDLTAYRRVISEAEIKAYLGVA